ncbi:uncharacterized protein METZ01_LOCUS367488 [marine metagenome]|uniref:Uncharacterized protein n=1 Tax=marine metagenome TaxID=408172 RepID=A0A382SXL1_9ZZZZ
MRLTFSEAKCPASVAEVFGFERGQGSEQIRTTFCSYLFTIMPILPCWQFLWNMKDNALKLNPDEREHTPSESSARNSQNSCRHMP